MRRLLIVTAVIEACAGVALLGFPSTTVRLLLGPALDVASAAMIWRLVGLVPLALGFANGLASRHGTSRGARRVVAGMTAYNISAAAGLAAFGVWHSPAGVLLWPTVVLHAAMAAWCMWSTLARPEKMMDSTDRIGKGAHP